jgi:hypothetical protein
VLVNTPYHGSGVFVRFENGFYMDGTFNVIKSSYYSPRSVCFCQGYDGETTPGLVKLTIDTLPCKCLKSYLELTKIKIKTDAKGSYIKINPLRVCPFFYDPCILPTIVMPLSTIYRSNFVSQVNTTVSLQE